MGELGMRKNETSCLRGVVRRGPGYRRGRIMWSPGPQVHTRCWRPQPLHMLCHQIHQRRTKQRGAPTATIEKVTAWETTLSLTLFRRAAVDHRSSTDALDELRGTADHSRSCADDSMRRQRR